MTAPSPQLNAAADFVRRVENANIRFAGRGPKGHSSTWTAFGRGSYYYIGSRPIMGSIKISLHESRLCRLALTEKLHNALPAEGLSQPADRAMVKWRRRETPERGAVHVLSVFFPSDHMVLPQPAATYRKPLLIFGEPPTGRAIEFGFFFSREDASAMEERFLRLGKPFVANRLEDGTTVSLVVRETTFDRGVLPSQENLNSSACTVLSREVFAIRGEQGGFGGLLWTSPKDGETLFLYEIGDISLRHGAN